MQAFVIIKNGQPEKICWTQQAAEAHGSTGAEIVRCEIDPLTVPVKEYFEYRGLKFPNAQEAFLFLTSELGELADELVSVVGGWVRNNPEGKGKGLLGEIGDVLMMLTMVCFALGLDPVACMFEKWAAKGFTGASRR
jgi:NTP pyrophosphatase (non-canonical NTP hydrolase)